MAGGKTECSRRRSNVEGDLGDVDGGAAAARLPTVKEEERRREEMWTAVHSGQGPAGKHGGVGREEWVAGEAVIVAGGWRKRAPMDLVQWRCCAVLSGTLVREVQGRRRARERCKVGEEPGRGAGAGAEGLHVVVIPVCVGGWCCVEALSYQLGCC